MSTSRRRRRSPGAPRQRPPRLLLALVGVVAAGLPLLAYITALLNTVEGSLVDARFAIRGSEGPSRGVVVVQIDDVTFDQLNQQWPFPRSLHARVIDRLRAAGARAIAYDVQFTEPTEAAQDNALISAVERAGNVVLATTEVGAHGETKVLGGGALLKRIGARVGSSVLLPAAGGVIRGMPYSVQKLTNFAIVSAQVATGRAVPPRGLPGRAAPIDYRGPPGTIDSVSFSRVLRGQVDPRRLRRRIAVVGASAPSLQDLHPVPTSGSQLMSGPEIEANQIDTVLRGVPLRDAPGFVNIALIVVLGLCVPAVSVRLAPLPVLAVALGVGALFLAVAQLAFNAGVIVAVIYPIAALALGIVLTVAVRYVVEALARQRTRLLFSRFVPEQVVDEVLARTDDDLRLGGKLVTGTVMFSDIRGFTTFAERIGPARVIEALNVYLNAMTDAIMDAGGTLVSYMGDGIMAVFGAPIEQPDHADRALVAARVMAQERLPAFNEWLRDNGFPDGFQIGVGIHSGQFMSGNIGSDRRVDYTVIGDTANTAARLEGMTKGTGHMVFVSEATRGALNGEATDLELVGEREVRGRQRRIRVWALV